jgi:hypothetical protein
VPRGAEAHAAAGPVWVAAIKLSGAAVGCGIRPCPGSSGAGSPRGRRQDAHGREQGARAARRGLIKLRTVGELDHKAAISRLALHKSEK